MATVAPLTKATPVSVGSRKASTSHPRTTSWSFAATGDITGRAAFWSHELASHALPRATGWVAPLTKPKYRRPVVATVAGLPIESRRSSVSTSDAPTSGHGSSKAAKAASAAGIGRHPSVVDRGRVVEGGRHGGAEHVGASVHQPSLPWRAC